MTDVSSTITAVTVFPDRARVTRTAMLDVATGPQRVRFADLPLSLHADSVRARARGTARATLLGVSLATQYFAETPAEKVHELEAELEALQDEQTARQGACAALERDSAYLDGLGTQSKLFARALTQSDHYALSNQESLFDFLARRRALVRARILHVQQDQRATAREIERLQHELATLRAARAPQRYVAEVELEVHAPGTLTLELVYLINGARWTPLYDLRLDEKLTVRYLASVTQSTGEDWQDVALTLSTAQPALTLIVPELNPWYVDVYVPAPPKARGGFLGGMQAQSAPMAPSGGATRGMMREEAEEQPADEAYAEVNISASGASVTYALPGHSDIPGNGEPRKVTVAEFPLEPRFDYVCAPKLAEAVYRRAQVTNASPYLLLPGQAQVFEGQDFLGSTEIELTAPNQEVDLTLGVDERLRVKRELKQRDVDRQLLGNRRRIRYRYSIELENLTGAEQRVLVRDQVPVARHESVKVKLESTEPRIEPGDLGALEWKLTLPHKAKVSVTFEFTVESPTSHTVTNLP